MVVGKQTGGMVYSITKTLVVLLKSVVFENAKRPNFLVGCYFNCLAFLIPMLNAKEE